MRTKTVEFAHTIYPDAEDELERLTAEEKRLALAIARRGDVDEAPKRRASEPLEDLDAQLAQVRADMAEQQAIVDSGKVLIVLRALPRRTKDDPNGRSAYRALLLEHPPREGDPWDQTVGYNVDTFGEALISACIVRTEDVHGDEVPNEWDEWAEDMTQGEWEEVFTTAHNLQKARKSNLPR